MFLNYHINDYYVYLLLICTMAKKIKLYSSETMFLKHADIYIFLTLLLIDIFLSVPQSRFFFFPQKHCIYIVECDKI